MQVGSEDVGRRSRRRGVLRDRAVAVRHGRVEEFGGAKRRDTAVLRRRRNKLQTVLASLHVSCGLEEAFRGEMGCVCGEEDEI